MKINTAEFVKSAPSLKDCPDFAGLPEIVLVGRSNVGKSSFINSMTHRKNLARTSNTPGKTRLINFYKINYSDDKKSMVFVDLPGYGYAKVSKSEQEAWRRNLELFLTQRKSIRRVVQLIDSRHGAQDNDTQMFEWLQYHGLPVLVVLTKTDKLSRNESVNRAATTAKAFDIDARDIITYSAENHNGRDVAWKLLEPQLTVIQIPPSAEHLPPPDEY